MQVLSVLLILITFQSMIWGQLGSNSNIKWTDFIKGPETPIVSTNNDQNVKWTDYIKQPGQPMRSVVAPSPSTRTNVRSDNQNVKWTDFIRQPGQSTPLTKNRDERPTIITNNVCGISTLVGNPLIYNGSPTIKGEFPWLVVMYVKKTRNLEFQCGGTLISEKVVLTAAHCIHPEENRVLSKNDIVLHVGRFDLDDWTDSVSPKIKNMFVHPDFKRHNDTSYDADIALITIIQKIEFTQFIRAICLGLDESPSVSQSGTVVGWGRDETGVATSKPNKIEMPVVSHRTCLDSEPTYQYITSDRTFCAGNRNGQGPCNGDSGGGFVMKVNGVWYLRGIVSVGLYDKETKSCDVRNYSVFTDVAKFLPWINMYL